MCPQGTRIAVTLLVGMAMGRLTLPARGETQRAIRILVAEDLDDRLDLFKAYMQGQPHVVVRATNGEEAVELATAGNFDLLFMDIRMPLMDG